MAELVPPAGILRLIVVVGGGLMVLQSTQDLDAGKLAYLALAGIAFVFSCRAVWSLRHRPMFAAAAPWLIASAILAGLIALSLPVSLAYGTPTNQWLRDAATYALFAAVPVLALDAATSMRSGLILALAGATTVLGTLSFAVYWVAARGVADLPFRAPLLPTASLPTALFVVSLAAAVVDRRRRVGWAILGGLAFGTFLITGSRSALIFVVVFPVVMIVAGRAWLRHSALASVGTGLVTLTFVTLVQASLLSSHDVLPIGAPPPAASASASTEPPTSRPAQSASESAESRPAPTLPPASGPNSTLIGRLQRFLASPLRDGSMRERVAQYEVAWNMFASSPVVGRGLGHPFVWTRLDGTVRSDITADTPLVL
ncbi:MAG: hypothetical protein ABI841_06680, partial [Chloroflexota bacterium]